MVRIVEENGDEPHNHQFSGVTGEEIRVPGGHIHRLRTRTDFFENHFHEINVLTERQVLVGEGDDQRHVHFIDAQTQEADDHRHRFIVTTFIENPIGERK